MNDKQSYSDSIMTIPLSARATAGSDSQLIKEARWIALENPDGSYTWIDQRLNTTKRICQSTLKNLSAALSEKEKTNQIQPINLTNIQGGQDVSIH